MKQTLDGETSSPTEIDEDLLTKGHYAYPLTQEFFQQHDTHHPGTQTPLQCDNFKSSKEAYIHQISI